MYHGWGRKRRYFEGWYFKMIDPSGQHAIAVIPGISMDPAGERHAFIQVFDGTRGQAFYYSFAEEEFRPSPKEFALHLGDNFFSSSRLRLELPDFQGELTFHNLHPWPKTLGAPGIMGWYSFVPFMECYHGVVSLHHHIEGRIQYREQTLPFDGGIGYMEKDWGTSFPGAWIWMQTNHFDQDQPVCLMASVARIPWIGSAFTGFIAGFLWEGQLHRFATYTGAKLQATVQDGCAKLVFEDKRHRLEATAWPAEGAALISPLKGEMTGKVNESIQARIEVVFCKDGKQVFSGTGKHAGLEIAGPVEKILSPG